MKTAKAHKFDLYTNGEYFDTLKTFEAAQLEGERNGLPYEVKPDTMNIFQRIIAKTPKRHKKIGQISTAVAGAVIYAAESGLFDQNPALKYSILSLGAALGFKALYHSQKVLK